MSEESVDLAIRILNYSEEIVALLAMVTVTRDVPIHVRDEATRLLEKLFVEREETHA
jgi:hypothetical protein